MDLQWCSVIKAKYMSTLCAGLMHLQTTSSRGRRVSAARAFLLPAAHRSNLDISTHSHVHRVSEVIITCDRKIMYFIVVPHVHCENKVR